MDKEDRGILLRIVAFREGQYSAEIWMRHYINNQFNFMKSLQDVCDNVTDEDANFVGGRLAQCGGWGIWPVDPQFRLGEFAHVYELVVPGWILTDVTDQKDPIALKSKRLWMEQ
jgi:hypothetical protein